MGDYNSGLPVRSEADGTDERVHVKIVDGTTPSQRAIVDTDGNVHVEVHGNDPSTADQTLKVSESGNASLDGFYNVATNSVPSSAADIVHSRVASPGLADQVIRHTGIIAASGNVRAADVSIFDENGIPFSASNPLPTTSVDSEGDEVNDYQTSAAVAAGSSVNHNYTVTALKTLKLSQVESSGSGKMKMAVKVETGVATGIFNTKWVMFNSTANPNIQLPIKELLSVAAGVIVRLTLTNRDQQPQDLFSTMSGHEV